MTILGGNRPGAKITKYAVLWGKSAEGERMKNALFLHPFCIPQQWQEGRLNA